MVGPTANNQYNIIHMKTIAILALTAAALVSCQQQQQQQNPPAEPPVAPPVVPSGK